MRHTDLKQHRGFSILRIVGEGDIELPPSPDHSFSLVPLALQGQCTAKGDTVETGGEISFQMKTVVKATGRYELLYVLWKE